MKLVVMSDSHGYDERVREVLKKEKGADYFIHLGDLCSDVRLFPQIIFVRGNNDYDYDMPEMLVSEFGGIRFLMVHGHRVSYFHRADDLAALGAKNHCQVVLYGHSHVFDDQMINGIRLLNPGSLMYNRDREDIGYYVIEINEKKYKVYRKYL